MGMSRDRSTIQALRAPSPRSPNPSHVCRMFPRRSRNRFSFVMRAGRLNCYSLQSSQTMTLMLVPPMPSSGERVKLRFPSTWPGLICNEREDMSIIRFLYGVVVICLCWVFLATETFAWEFTLRSTSTFEYDFYNQKATNGFFGKSEY